MRRLAGLILLLVGGMGVAMAYDATLEKKLPANLEAERAVLGAILLDNEALDLVLGIVQPQDFFSAANRRIMTRLLALGEARRPADLTTLRDELEKAAELEAAGGSAYLASLVDGVPRVSNVEHYAKIVKQKARLRALIHTAYNVIGQAFEAEEDPEEILDRSLQALHTLVEDTPAEGVSFREAATRLLQSFDDKDTLRIFTGLEELDKIIGGFRPGELVVYTAEVGVGKSLFAAQTRQRACQDGWHALLASGEMKAEHLEARELATKAEVPHWKMRRPERLDRDDLARLLVAAAKECTTCQILDGEITLRRIRAKARRMRRESRLGLVIVDYDELVDAPGKDEWEQQRNLVRGLKSLGMELNCPVILISQLRKMLQGEDRKRPTLQRIYGTGAKTKHPTTIIYVDRQWVRELKGDETEARLCVLKNRDGRMGALDAYFNIKTLRFESKPAEPSEKDSTPELPGVREAGDEL